jgi:hypothetical protein
MLSLKGWTIKMEQDRLTGYRRIKISCEHFVNQAMETLKRRGTWISKSQGYYARFICPSWRLLYRSLGHHCGQGKETHVSRGHIHWMLTCAHEILSLGPKTMCSELGPLCIGITGRRQFGAAIEHKTCTRLIVCIGSINVKYTGNYTYAHVCYVVIPLLVICVLTCIMSVICICEMYVHQA